MKMSAQHMRDLRRDELIPSSQLFLSSGLGGVSKLTVYL